MRFNHTNLIEGYAFLLRYVLSSYGLNLENGDYFFQVMN